MKAARLIEYGKPLKIVEMDIPKPLGHQVVLKVAGTGACRTDFYICQGRDANRTAADLGT